jgi:hypothetical protein
MYEKTLIIKGYQPVEGKVQDGFQPSADAKREKQNGSAPTPAAAIKPPKGGTGETTLKKK